jgi:hypothetical protein
MFTTSGLKKWAQLTIELTNLMKDQFPVGGNHADSPQLPRYQKIHILLNKLISDHPKSPSEKLNYFSECIVPLFALIPSVLKLSSEQLEEWMINKRN